MSRPNHNHNRCLLCLWALLLLWAVCSPAWAQGRIFYLKNGDRLTGVIVSEDAQKLVLKSPTLGTITVPISEIARREPQPVDPPTPATPPQPPPATNAPPAKPAATTAAKPAPKPAQPPGKNPPPKQQVKAPAAPKPKGPKLWFFDAQVGANLQINQRDLQVYYGNFNVRYAKNPLRINLSAKANYGTVDGVMSANNADGMGRLEYDLSKRFFFFNAATAGYDEIRRIDLRYDDGAGLGYKVFTMPNMTLSFDLGANYQKQYFTDGTEPSFFSARLGEAFTWKINSRISFDQRIEFLPREYLDDNFQLRLSANLSYLLTEYLTLNLNVSDLYDSRPAGGVTPNDLQIRTSVGVKF